MSGSFIVLNSRLFARYTLILYFKEVSKIKNKMLKMSEFGPVRLSKYHMNVSLSLFCFLFLPEPMRTCGMRFSVSLYPTQFKSVTWDTTGGNGTQGVYSWLTDNSRKPHTVIFRCHVGRMQRTVHISLHKTIFTQHLSL